MKGVPSCLRAHQIERPLNRRKLRLPVWARHWLSLPIRKIPIRVRGGPNRGWKWSLAVSGRGTISGRYEVERFGALATLVRPEEVLSDIGAHYGYATLIAA